MVECIRSPLEYNLSRLSDAAKWGFSPGFTASVLVAGLALGVEKGFLFHAPIFAKTGNNPLSFGLGARLT